MANAMRPVSKVVNDALGSIPKGAFNFGLYFQKWFYIDAEPPWKCHTDQPKKKGADGHALLDNMPTSLNLVNGKGITIGEDSGNWSREKASDALKIRHMALESYAAALGKLGYDYLKFEFSLLSPLVIGLGNEHPTEKGFRFDWALGVPAIPASSIKGVLRLAALVNELNRYPDLEAAEPLLADLQKEKWPGDLRRLFGAGGEKDALRGKVIFFDAYPSTLPKLKAEIMNCHYPDYYRDERGPTEDQKPNPQKFWAVDRLDDKGAPLVFIFRLLVEKEIAADNESRKWLEDALKASLEDHGLGAKTAIGHGRLSNGARVEESPQPATVVRKLVERETWKGATIWWDRGKETFSAASGANKRATGKGKDLVVPEALQAALFGKKKQARANVVVEKVGNAFTIIRIETES